MPINLFSKAAIVGVALVFAQAASAAVLDFAAEADTNGERGVVDGTVIENMMGSGFDVRLSATGGFAYLDESVSAKPGGLGVCTVLYNTNQCNPNSDDNISGGETVFIEIGADTGPGFTAEKGNIFTGLFRDKDHNFFAGNFDYSLDGGASWLSAMILATANGVYDFGGAAYTAAGLGFRYVAQPGDGRFYVSQLSVVPVPAAGLLLLGGLGAFGFMGRRRRKAA